MQEGHLKVVSVCAAVGPQSRRAASNGRSEAHPWSLMRTMRGRWETTAAAPRFRCLQRWPWRRVASAVCRRRDISYALLWGSLVAAQLMGTGAPDAISRRAMGSSWRVGSAPASSPSFFSLPFFLMFLMPGLMAFWSKGSFLWVFWVGILS